MTSTATTSIATSIAEIQQCFDQSSKADGQGPLVKPSDVHYRLSDLLGTPENPEQYWWRAIIDPRHFEAALEKSPDDPGSLYDEVSPDENVAAGPGYRQSMLEAFRKYLDADLSKIALTFDTYLDMAKATATGGTFLLRGSLDTAEYETAQPLATDLAPLPTDLTTVDPRYYDGFLLKKRLALSAAEQGTAFWTSQVTPLKGKATNISALGCKDWRKPMDQVFSDLADDVKVPTKIQQLQGIARCIRRIHMLHPLKTGNSAINISLLLNHLLLRHGFGLPIGGKDRSKLQDAQPLAQLFQGGYTVEQIAKYLWVAQDFGLKSKNHKDTVLGPDVFVNKITSNKRDSASTADRHRHAKKTSSKSLVATTKSSTGQAQVSVRAPPPTEPQVLATASPVNKAPRASQTPAPVFSQTTDTAANILLRTETQPITAHVYVNALTTIAHNGDEANTSTDGVQTTVNHNGDQTIVTHGDEHSTVGRSGSSPAMTVLSHPDGSHTTVSSASSNTTVTHHATTPLPAAHNVAAPPAHAPVTPLANNPTTPSGHSSTVSPAHNASPPVSHGSVVSPVHDPAAVPGHNTAAGPAHNPAAVPGHNTAAGPAHNPAAPPAHNPVAPPGGNPAAQDHQASKSREWTDSDADLLELANCVGAAYQAYQGWQGGEVRPDALPKPKPEDIARARGVIQTALSAYHFGPTTTFENITPIFVWEDYPNGRPAIPNLPFIGKSFNEYKKGYQLIGFSATQVNSTPTRTVRNVCVLRGTVTKSEVTASVGGDALSWVAETNVKYAAPTTDTAIGKTKASFWSWYNDAAGYESLAASIRSSVTLVKAANGPSIPWAFTGHSLGGGLITLAALDIALTSLLAASPTVVTYGSVMVGDETFAKTYNAKIPKHIRVENACDFVPTLQGFNVSPLDVHDEPKYAFKPVGTFKRFILQRYGLWGNHSFVQVYLKAMTTRSAYPFVVPTPKSMDELD